MKMKIKGKQLQIPGKHTVYFTLFSIVAAQLKNFSNGIKQKLLCTAHSTCTLTRFFSHSLTRSLNRLSSLKIVFSVQPEYRVHIFINCLIIAQWAFVYAIWINICSGLLPIYNSHYVY